MNHDRNIAEAIADNLLDDYIDLLAENKLMRTALDNRRIRPLTNDQLHALSRVHWDHQSNQLNYITFARAIEEIHNCGRTND